MTIHEPAEAHRAADLIDRAIDARLRRRHVLFAEALDALSGRRAVVPEDTVATAASSRLEGDVADLWLRGWQPRELASVARRQLEGRAPAMVLAAIAAQQREYPERICWATAEWVAQVHELAPPLGEEWFGALAARAGGLRHGLHQLVDASCLLARLPALAPLLPPPQRWEEEPRVSRDGAAPADPQLLARVRALLAKAESTEFAEEAEAFSEKAQELMARHRLDRALLESPEQHAHVSSARLPVENPYSEAKSILLQRVAEANGCRSVYLTDLGLASLFGSATDLELVETLFTSLLLQADAAMRASEQDLVGRRRVRSFRRSFLLAYAERIGERLAEGVTAAASSLDEHSRDRALPVLAQREAEVEEAMAAEFPGMVRRRVAVSNPAGWAAGRAAADLADFAAGPAVR